MNLKIISDYTIDLINIKSMTYTHNGCLLYYYNVTNQVCFAHGGGSFPYTIGRIEHGFNVRPDLCAVSCDVNPREYLGRIYTDSLVHDDNALDLLLKTIGQVSQMYYYYIFTVDFSVLG